MQLKEQHHLAKFASLLKQQERNKALRARTRSSIMENRQSKLSENCKTKSAQKQWCEEGLTDRKRLDSKDFERKRRNSSF